MNEVKEHATITIPLLEYGKLNRELTTLRTRLAEVESTCDFAAKWLTEQCVLHETHPVIKRLRRDAFLNPTNKDVM